ncbi:MAG TPA: carbon monoxide dehydrogenase, partial [Paraburkholderia sp.]
VASDNGTPADKPHRTLNFKARAAGLGSLRGQIDVALRADDHLPVLAKGPSTRIDYSVWATSTGPLAELPARQIENALHELADDFFTEFCAVVQAKHGQGPNLARGAAPRRQHVFLRPISLAGVARRTRHDHGGALTGRAVHSTIGARAHHEHNPHAVPHWAWAAMIFFVALLLYVARWFGAS